MAKIRVGTKIQKCFHWPRLLSIIGPAMLYQHQKRGAPTLIERIHGKTNFSDEVVKAPDHIIDFVLRSGRTRSTSVERTRFVCGKEVAHHRAAELFYRRSQAGKLMVERKSGNIGNGGGLNELGHVAEQAQARESFAKWAPTPTSKSEPAALLALFLVALAQDERG